MLLNATIKRVEIPEERRISWEANRILMLAKLVKKKETYILPV